MATYDDVPINPTDIVDVPFERASSTRVLKYYNPHQKASRQESLGKKSTASAANIGSPYGYTGSHQVTRTGGVTGLLTATQQVAPPSPKPHAPLRPQISAPENGEVLHSKKPMPSDDVLNALFTRLMERMKLPPERVAELNSRTAEQKWSLVLAQHEVQAGIACVFYIEQLVRHAQPELKEKRPRKKMLENLQPLSEILTKLEVDLRTNPNDSWIQEFVNTPNHGHVALIDLIKDLADNPYSVPRKNPKKYSVLHREAGYLNISLLCLRALMSHKKGFKAVLNYDPSLCVLAYCLNNESIRVKILILNLLLTVLLAPGGHRKVMQAFDYSRAIMKERTRFQMLIESLVSEPVDPAYQAAALRFINTIVQTAKGPNAKVFYQHEFKEAGFSPIAVEKTLHGRQDERVIHELKEWQNNFISVQEYMDDLAVMKGKARNLREDRDKFKKHLYEANLDRENLYEQIKKWISRYDRLRDENERNSRTISELLDAKLERDELLEENIQLLDANKRYHVHATELKQKVQSLLAENVALQGKEKELSSLQTQVDSLQKLQTMAGGTEQLSESQQPPPAEEENTKEGGTTEPDQPAPNIPAPPPLPPIIGSDPTSIPPFIPIGGPIPPPPPIGGSGLAGMQIKKPIIPNVPLPMLNWVPIRNPEHTIFKDLNDENVIETVDFSEFEALFQIKRFKKKEQSSSKTDETDQAKPTEQLCLIENRRARNMVIAKRRIGCSAVEIRDCILQTDLDCLLGEHCELLLKFIPTQEELTELAKNVHKFSSFGEAEKFMYQLAKIDRYESRLNCMAYLGNFDELYSATQPRINAVLQASLSVFRSARLKKVFEIILAFGNYMNSSRRGAVYGFKLESLTKLLDTKSLDRKQTLLHYIVHVVELVYPHVLSFYEDLDIEEACKVSNQILNEDVGLLKNGLEDIKSEKEKEPTNFILFSFYRMVSKKVLHLSESFTKMEDAYREVCLMFSESPKTMDPSDFFGMFATFIDEWKKAVQANHDSKRRHKSKASDLLKKKQDEETMADIASEVAAEAAARAKRIYEETQKLSVKLKERSEEESKVEGESEVVQDLEAEQKLKDAKKRSVHQINLQKRLPWLNKSEPDDVEQPPPRVTSPDSGVMDTLSETTDPSETMSPLHTTLTPISTAEHNEYTAPENIIENGHDSGTDDEDEDDDDEDEDSDSDDDGSDDSDEDDSGDSGEDADESLDIPPRDYPVELPSKDYPDVTTTSLANGTPSTKQAQTDLFGGADDYYNIMTNGITD